MKNIKTYYENLSQNSIKLIKSLQQKKQREQHQLYVIEGDKIVREYLNASRKKECVVKYVCATSSWLKGHGRFLKDSGTPVYAVHEKDLKRMSSLMTPQEVMAVVQSGRAAYHPGVLSGTFSLAFDAIRDPGNFGTIIRTADWFGISTILCSHDSVDVYNPKVIQSAMGSTLRVNVFYAPLQELFSDAENLKIPVYGTFMEGKPVYNHSFPEEMIILFGNESSGIDEMLLPWITEKIAIPQYPPGRKSAESLNIASAVAVIVSETRRKKQVDDYSK